MLWLRSHRRFTEQLSAYIDGELGAPEALALEAHLQSCDSCVTELAELRLTSAALGDLSDVHVPRSFALSAADVSNPVPSRDGIRSLNSGLRLTGGVLAAALAVLLVMDTGGVLDNGREDSSERAATGNPLGLTGADSLDDEDISKSMDFGAAEGYIADEPSAPESTSGGADGVGGGVSGVSPAPEGGAPAETAAPGARGAPVPTQEPAPSAPPSTAAGGDEDAAAPSPDAQAQGLTEITASPAERPPGDLSYQMSPDSTLEEEKETLNVLDTEVDSNGGPSAVVITEIVLAALLGMAIIGIGAATYAERRRR
jgi:hypothetical protein